MGRKAMNTERAISSKSAWRKQGTRRRHHIRPCMELLEDRLAPANTLHWDGGIDANWGSKIVNPFTGEIVATNWKNKALPVAGDTLVFDDTASGNFSTNNDLTGPLFTPFALAGISINTNAGYAFNGNPIRITSAAGITYSSPLIGSHPLSTINLDV